MNDVAMKVLVVHQETTTGQSLSGRVLGSLIRSVGWQLSEAHPRFPRLPRVLQRQPWIDLIEALYLRAATLSEIGRFTPSLVILPSVTAALLLPRVVLNHAVLRFDSLAAENRPGLRGLPSRFLERRALRHVVGVMPYSSYSGEDSSRRALLSRTPTRPLPTPISRAPITTGDGVRSRIVLCYAGNPVKKGLDLILAAWREAGLSDHVLEVAGLEEADGSAYLQQVPSALQRTVHFLGPLSHEQFLKRLRAADVFLASARYEEFGIAPLEALASRTVVVTALSRGPFEAGLLLTRCCPWLVTPLGDAVLLGKSLRKAVGLSTSDRERLVTRLEWISRRYQRPAVEQYFRDHVAGWLAECSTVVAQNTSTAGAKAGIL